MRQAAGLNTYFTCPSRLQEHRLAEHDRGMLSIDSLKQALQLSKNIVPAQQPPFLPAHFSSLLFTTRETTPVYRVYEALIDDLHSTVLILWLS